MNEDQWRAPGRERADGVPPEHGAPGPFPPPAIPYAGPGPDAPPSVTTPYAPAPAPGAPSHPTEPYQQPQHPTDGSAFATSDRHRERVLAGAGYDSPAYTNDNAAVVSIVCGVIGIIIPGVCLLAIAFGHLALRRLRTSYEGGRGLAVAGLTMGYAMTAIWLAIFLLFLTVRSLV